MRAGRRGRPSRPTLWALVASLFVAASGALVAHDEPSANSPRPPPAVEHALAVHALEDLASAGIIPGASRARTAPEGNRGPAAHSTSTPGQVESVPSLPVDLPVGAPLGSPAGIDAYRGMGTWVDVYDWSNTYTRGRPQVGPSAVDRMAEVGVQTLYIQASKHDAATDVLEPGLLRAWIDRARQRGIRVVAWYLPTLSDTAKDLQRMVAIANLPVDSVAVDIESKDVADLAERNRRLVAFSTRLRRALPGRVIGGIVLPPVVLEVVNPLYWPSFPYRELADSYDVWLPMGYWTNRLAGSPYRNAHRYTRENVNRLRANLGQPRAAVHAIGGIADRTTAADVAGYRQASAETGTLGGSLYDWRTTRAELWTAMRPFRR